MTVNVSKPVVNVREKLAELDKPTGIAGEAMLRAETPQEQFNLIGAGRRNLIINGDMRIWQRGVGPISAVAGNTFCADRWQMGRYGSATGVFTGEQSTDAPDGFRNSVKLTVTTTDTPSAQEAYLFTQPFEGLTIDPLAYETPSAKTINVSFWVKSSIVGTYAVSMQDGPAQRACTTSYTINSANTWEYKSVTFVGDTGSGSYEQGLTTKGGMIIFGLGGAGNRLASSMDTWYNSGGYTISMPKSGGTNWIVTSGATWQITGVQLELGKVATPFEHRSYGEELALCQRYYQQYDLAAYTRLGLGYSDVNNRVIAVIPTAQTIRAMTSVGHSNLLVDGNAITSTSASVSGAGGNTVMCTFGVSGTPFTVGQVYQVLTYGSTGYFFINGEL
jgi:hypothetical protein